jgi:hypothetical protein
MKSIEQNVGVVFSAIEIQDAIIIAPLMDELINVLNIIRRYNKYMSLNQKEREMYKRPDGYTESFGSLNYTSINNIYKTLTAHGYCGTGNIDLLPDGYPLVAKN